MNTITVDSKIYRGAEIKESDDYLDSLDEDLMKQTFEAAHQDYLAGRCIPNSQMVDYIKSELGWK